jgi:hypothetical protein
MISLIFVQYLLFKLPYGYVINVNFLFINYLIFLVFYQLCFSIKEKKFVCAPYIDNTCLIIDNKILQNHSLPLFFFPSLCFS